MSFLLSVLACGGGGGSSSSGSGSGSGSGSPSISAEGVQDFGTVVIPNTSSRLLTIRNSGTANLSIGQIALQQAGTPFAIAADSCSNTSIPAAGTCQVSLQLVTNAQSVQGVFSNTLSIPSNDTANNPLTLPLTGQIRKYFVSINEILTSNCPATLKLFVSVIDSAGVAVAGLENIIKLFENGNPALNPIVALDPSNLTVALLLDYSPSIQNLDVIEGAAKVFVDQLSGGDKAAVLKFAKTRQPASFTFTDDTTVLNGLIDAPFTGDTTGTVLYDVVYDAVGAVNNAQSIPRRAVVVLSDGLDVGSTRTLDQAIDRAVQAGIPVFAIAITDAVDPQPTVMKRLADETGGVYFEASSATEVEDIYLQIAGILSEQYSIQYTTTSSGGATIALDVEVDENADQVNEGEASRDAIGCP
jgi:VWFA-related protein